jgi:hypothetical protein
MSVVELQLIEESWKNTMRRKLLETALLESARSVELL